MAKSKIKHQVMSMAEQMAATNSPQFKDFMARIKAPLAPIEAEVAVLSAPAIETEPVVELPALVDPLLSPPLAALVDEEVTGDVSTDSAASDPIPSVLGDGHETNVPTVSTALVETPAPLLPVQKAGPALKKSSTLAGEIGSKSVESYQSCFLVKKDLAKLGSIRFRVSDRTNMILEILSRYTEVNGEEVPVTTLIDTILNHHFKTYQKEVEWIRDNLHKMEQARYSSVKF